MVGKALGVLWNAGWERYVVGKPPEIIFIFSFYERFRAPILMRQCFMPFQGNGMVQVQFLQQNRGTST